ncbi:MAG: hypothetical protein KGY74_06875 [Candidatus Cloacimonetes bacterium]|nr:hypothetical protein [Candidatus Cloacimonadota bacterium]
MKKLYIAIFVILLIIVLSCSLDRTNPLDPEVNSNIYTPPRVDSLWVYFNNFKLTWIKPYYHDQDTTIYADGYFVWGARSWNTKFDLIDNNVGADNTIIDVEEFYVERNYLVFRVSSYLVYPPNDTLVGYSSKAVTFQN